MFGGILLVSAQPLCAQNRQPDSAPTDIPDVPPSVNDYRLPPGRGTSTPANPAEGPVDEGSSAPVANIPVRTPEIPENPPPTLPDIGPGQTERADSPVPSAPRSPPTRAEVPNTIVSEGGSRTDEIDPIELPAIGRSETRLQSEARDVEPVPPEAVQETSATWIKSLIGLGSFIILTGLGLFIWRRKKSRAAPETKKQNFVEAGLEPEPEFEVETVHIKKAAPPLSSGNITSRILPAPLPHSNGPDTNPASRRPDGFIRIIFTAENVSTTLFNAVLGYQISLTNKSDRRLGDIKLQAIMAQANGESIKNMPVLPNEILHHLQEILPGKTVILSGELRLPFNAIIPIRVNGQALLIPLARFGIRYVTEDGTVKQQSASYIVGQEHAPRRAKMAPFRLDIGPRRFGPAGQRQL